MSEAVPKPSHPLLDRLWHGYVADVPVARRFTELCDGSFDNDHIALRSLARDGQGSGLAVFVPVFEQLGWRVVEDYTFPDVHLHAVYLAQRGLPRVFISELDVAALPADARNAVLRTPPDTAPDAAWTADSAKTDFDALASWFMASPPPDRVDVELVARCSQYGAWVMCFGRRVNHFTATVDDVEAWHRRLRQAGVAMKPEIEGPVIAPGGCGLRQTATAAVNVIVEFSDGSRSPRPYAYFEIAERKGGFDGFLAGQARHLFDQTRG